MYQFLLESTGAEDAPTKACGCGPNAVCPQCSPQNHGLTYPVSENNWALNNRGEWIDATTGHKINFTISSYDTCEGDYETCRKADCNCENEDVDDDYDEPIYTEDQLQEILKEAVDGAWLKGYKEGSDQLKEGTYREATKDGYDKGFQTGYHQGFSEGYKKQAIERINVKVDVESMKHEGVGVINPYRAWKREDEVDTPKTSQDAHDSAVSKLLNRYGKK